MLRSIDLPSFWERVQGHESRVDCCSRWPRTRSTQSIAVWRWNRLLRAQHIEVEPRRLTESIWVSMFFNNFLPSNIGGDVVRIADTAPAAGSKTLATTVILVDRVLGLTALVLVAASGAFAASLLGVHVPGARWLWMASALGVVAAISVIAMPQLVGHALDARSRAEQAVAHRTGATARRCGDSLQKCARRHWPARSVAHLSCRSQLWPFIC